MYAYGRRASRERRSTRVKIYYDARGSEMARGRGSTRVKRGEAPGGGRRAKGERITTERARGKGEAGSSGWMIAADRAREDRKAERERERESEAVGKMNSRWQSDNPVRSIGKYLPLRRRRTHAAAYTLKHALMYVETRYIHDGAETRLCTVRYAPCALRVCRFMCKHRAGVCGRCTHTRTHVRT